MYTTDATRSELVSALCRELNALARREEEAAADEASRTPYWLACPPSVQARRAAARLLRADVDRLRSESAILPEAS
jgi:hypothetical protein